MKNILCILKMRFISLILLLMLQTRSPSAAWHRFAFLRQMNIPAPSGNSMATAQSPLYSDREMLSPAHQSPCLILYLLSLSPYHSRDVFQSPLSATLSLRLLSLSRDKTLPRLWNIYYKTWLSMLAFHARVSLCSRQSEKRNSLPDDESRRLIGERISDIISYFVQLCISRASFFSQFYCQYIKRYAILIFTYLYSNYM